LGEASAARAVVDPALEALWKRVVDAWDDEAAHAAFLEHCRHHEQLVEAAVRYRGMVGDHARSAAAKKKLDAVALIAMAELDVTRQRERRPVSHASSYALLAFFLVATIGLLAYLGVIR
jgi:hypothetical protein